MTTATIQCPSCDTAFPVDPSKIPSGGARTECTVCETPFRVDPLAPPLGRAAEDDLTAGGMEFGSMEGLEAVGAFDEDESPGTTTEEDAADVFGMELEDWALESDSTPTEEGVEEAEASPATEEPEHEGPDAAGDPEWEWSPEVVAPESDVASGERAAEQAPETVEPDEVEGGPGDQEPPATFQFGRRDPHDKARRLARVLVSDMITYNPERHARALENDSIREDFEDEIEKSWDEYVEQVGRDLAESTDYWKTALNDILARGKPLF